MKIHLNDIDPLFKFGEIVHATPKEVAPPPPKPMSDWRFAMATDLVHPDAPKKMTYQNLPKKFSERLKDPFNKPLVNHGTMPAWFAWTPEMGQPVPDFVKVMVNLVDGQEMGPNQAFKWNWNEDSTIRYWRMA